MGLGGTRKDLALTYVTSGSQSVSLYIYVDLSLGDITN